MDIPGQADSSRNRLHPWLIEPHMTILFNKTRLLALCLALSVLTHILIVYALRMSGTYNFTTPVSRSQVVVVDLATSNSTDSPSMSPKKQKSGDVGKDVTFGVNPDSAMGHDPDIPPANPEQRHPAPEPADPAVSGAEKRGSGIRSSESSGIHSPDASLQSVTSHLNLPLLSSAGNFLSTKSEKLTYLISMLGMPIGSAELEAKNENGEIRLTLRVRSNAAISTFYPVDDIVETRHIDGKFILATIKQQEGSFRSDEGFTINLRKKRVSWVDNMLGRSQTVTVPTDEVLDTLSGIYLLRNRRLQVGKTETLHIFDSESYADVPVEILRRETVRLPNFTTVDTLVVQPLQKSAGIFRRTGDILIWMTDDVYRVPVKIVSSVALGTVTVELMSAESQPLEEKVTESE
jgi:hypothetical protein